MMRTRSSLPDGPVMKIAVNLRTDQVEALDALGQREDLNRSQVVRRLLDLGLRHWPGRPDDRQN